ncbi:hypothetical protein PybrP1_010156 [[Pythium] brassicae (nom. inval.)]|nr:hypothetical protein PybrP1_010156 [[Pythium] brassicae (nom. inval.)]
MERRVLMPRSPSVPANAAANAHSVKTERTPLLPNSRVSPLPSNESDDNNDNAGSAQDLVSPRGLLQHARVRTAVIWLAASGVLFLTNQLSTLPVGFFPAYARQAFGMTPAQLSLFFALYPLCIMMSSPLAAAVSLAVGRQTVICVGLVVSGTTTVAFAYASAVHALFALRVLQGLGAGAAVVGAFSMLSDEFSASVGTVLAVQELVVAASFVSAPPIGSLLFQYQGYQLPFLASGVAQILLVMLVPFLFIEYSLPDGLYGRGPVRRSGSFYFPSGKHDTVGFRDVLTPTCALCLLATAFAMASFGFIDPYLGSHLQAVLGAQYVAVGLAFALSALVYFLGGVAYLWLSRHVGCKRAILLGLLQLVVGFFLLGPPPFLNALFRDGRALWATQSLALALIGCGAALAIAPGLPLTLASVSAAGPQATNLVIGLFSAAIYLGQALGPFVALLLLAVLPQSNLPNCTVLEQDASRPCKSALPWAFTTFALLAAALLGFVAWKLPTGEATEEMLQDKRKRFSLTRQASEYGQFVFFDEDECTDDDVGP